MMHEVWIGDLICANNNKKKKKTHTRQQPPSIQSCWIIIHFKKLPIIVVGRLSRFNCMQRTHTHFKSGIMANAKEIMQNCALSALNSNNKNYYRLKPNAKFPLQICWFHHLSRSLHRFSQHRRLLFACFFIMYARLTSTHWVRCGYTSVAWLSERCFGFLSDSVESEKLLLGINSKLFALNMSQTFIIMSL